MRVLLVGPAPAGATSRGGMATVMRTMLDHPDPAFEVRHVSTFVDSSIAQRIAVGVSGALMSAALVLFGRVDVVHVHLAHGGSVLRKAVPLLAARFKGVPTVIHAHSFDFEGWYLGLPRPVRRAVRAGLPATRWLILGHGLAQRYSDILELDPTTVDVLYNPVETGHFTTPAPDDGPLVRAVSLGRMGIRKGSYDLVAAAKLLEPAVRDSLEIVMAGDGEVEQIRALVDREGLADTVTVLSWIGPEERDELISRCQLFLLPSYGEGLPMALLEAMAAGLAPIVTSVGSIAEVVTDGVDALVVEPGDTDALARALTRAVSDDDLRRRLGSSAAQRAAQFDVAEWYADLGRLWSDLAAGSQVRQATSAIQKSAIQNGR